MAKVKVLKDFRDKTNHNNWKSKGYEFETTDERAAELQAKGIVEILQGGEVKPPTPQQPRKDSDKEKKEITKP